MLLPRYSPSDITEKKVLLRLDLDVADNDLRLERASTTIKELLNFNAKAVVICGHRGRPEGKYDPALSLRPIKDRLEILLNKLGVQDKINFITEIKPVPDSLPGRLMMLENLRFWSGEKNNDSKFAAALAQWGEAYVNDAFGACHRGDASLAAITIVIKEYFAGPNLAQEMQEQEKFMANTGAGLVVVLGGIKISTKLPLIKNLLPKASAILLGGG
ncbi:MAG: phosphoglycerate kinase, partial [Candidatus Komeilibacteria bacterium]|nr:phosphoglycerate kinase [Candidatus Komeilibacteria bacterium]